MSGEEPVAESARGRFIDFDAFRAEQRTDPLIIRVGGRDYALPSSPPAAVALDAIRLAHGGAATIPPEAIAGLAEGLFGRPLLDELTGVHRLTVDELQALIGQVMDAYAGEANPPPNRASRRTQRRTPSTSSRSGRSSRPTSPANTGSISVPSSPP